MKARVYYITAHSRTFAYESGLEGKFENFLKGFNLSTYITRDEVVPIKMHLGNRGAFRTIRPQFVKLVNEFGNKSSSGGYAYEYEIEQKESLTSDSRGVYLGFFICHLAHEPEYGFGRRTKTNSTAKARNRWQSFDAAFGKKKFFKGVQFRTITVKHSFEYALGSIWNQSSRVWQTDCAFCKKSARDRHLCCNC